MNSDERFLYMQAAEGEFKALCAAIVHDGRDPDLVAFAMTGELGKTLTYYQSLWDASEIAP